MIRLFITAVVLVGMVAVIWVLGRQVGTASDLVLHEVRSVSDGAKRRAQEVDHLTGADVRTTIDRSAGDQSTGNQSMGDGHEESVPVLVSPPPTTAPRVTPPVRAVRRGLPLRVGATMVQVQSVMGDPEVRTWDERGGETWWYGHSSIVLRNRAVASWSEVETPLGAAR